MLDFGLAKAFDPATAVSIDSLSSPTISVGTQLAWCSAPRRIMHRAGEGRSVDRRADIWAFGVVL